MKKRGSSRKLRQKRTKQFNLRKILRILSLIIILFIAVLFIKLAISPSVWDKKYQFSFTYPTINGVMVAVLNPINKTATNIFIPENTQAEVANQLGKWRLGSVWKLGKQEKVGGYLLSRSLIKSFSLPIDAWAAESINNYNGNFLNRTKAIFLTSDTNIKLKDKIRLWLFMFVIPKGNNQTIFLAETSALNPSRLPDGSEGYLINQLLDSIERLFFVDMVSQENLRLGVVNVADNSGAINMVVETLETIGVRPVIIKEEEYLDGFLCAVYTDEKESITAKKISYVFNCPIKEKRSESNLDIEFIYGEEFIQRF